ncbi:uncharacterized protein LOC121779504 [Salvia splendens]|uniref:uncharacterized protein LOC121779504 n=1 Tax=Salvia splendens TaxID=180675 RepID=UPI001C259DA6|nr:uncharacterized protein LOC121779504 [Salvia splendens]
MTGVDSSMGGTESVGLTQPSSATVVDPISPMTDVVSQLAQLTAVVSSLQSTITAPDLRVPNFSSTIRPTPAPPFGLTFSTQFPAISTPPTAFQQIQHTSGMPYSVPPGFGAHYLSLPQTLGSTFSQPTISASTIPFSLPPFGISEVGSTTVSAFRPHLVQPDQQWLLSQGRNPLQRPPLINPLSAWGPPTQRPQFGTLQNDQYFSKGRMEPPRFDGSEVNNWIRGIQFYFDHVGTPDSHRLHYVIMLFEPNVADWIWNYAASHEQATWNEFLDDVRRRFDPNCYTSHVGLLKKLTQTGTVYDYQLAFEKLQNNVVGVPDHVLLDLYVAGLRQPIQDEVLLHRPTSLAAAFALAIRLAACRSETLQSSAGFQKRPWQPCENRSVTVTPSTQPGSQASLAGTYRTRAANSGTSDISKLPIIRLSGAEKADHARRGLCYYCDEKWISGHVCKHRFLAYMGGDDDDDEDESDDTDPSGVNNEVVTADLSHLHAIDGKRRGKSLTLSGNISSESVTILVDTGSSHDFLHPRIAERLRLPLTAIRPFRVYVGNGEYIVCSHVSKGTQLCVQGTPFAIDLHVLPIHGPDVILGMDWLESLGRVTTDFVAKSMEFYRGKDLITLQGSAHPPRQISLASLHTLVSRDSLFELYELVQLTPDPPQLLQLEADAIPGDLPSVIDAALRDFPEVFALPTGLPPVRQFDHRIHLLPHSKHVNVRPYRYPYFQKNEIEKQVKEMLDQGVIQRSHSPFSSPVLLVRKKDGTFRFCIDYRALNKATVPDHFPIPTADELFDELGAARFFTKLDLRSGYHQIRMHEDDTYKTAFRTHDGHFEFLVMPFGLTNAPSTFQSAMNCIFQPLLRKSVIVFFDDILVYSPTVELHAAHLRQVLSTLADNQFFVKLSKCSFCSPTVDYLGHLITEGHLKADPAKIEAMVAWPTPSTVKQLRGFLGLTGYYRRFIARYAMIAAPLTELLKKEAFCWSQAASASFDALKQAMTAAPVLRLPDFSSTFYLETDACDFGIGAVLMQEGHPLAFFSKKLGPRRRSASTYHKELYAIVEAVQKWRQYLLGREFVIRSDQKSLKELLQQVIQTPEQQLYVRKLMGYKFTIEYKSGAANRVADALSRRDEEVDADAALLMAVAHPMPDILTLLRKETATSPDLCVPRRKIESGEAEPRYTFCDGLIYCGRRIYVSEKSPLRDALIYEHHSTPQAGHPGFDRTLRRLATQFFWPRMRSDVKIFVAACVDCQTTKYSTQKPSGLLQPLPIPTQVWEDVSMDFIVGLPLSRGYTTIMVVVDRLSKYAHFAPLPARFDAMRVARLFIDTVVKHHGFPKTLVSDRDPIFLSDVWRDMLQLSGTSLHFSTAYHPQTDGQTEVRNRGLEQYLRSFTADRPTKWANFLPWAELALNCFHHEGLGTSPFRALYGREPPALIAVQPSAARTDPEVADLIQQRGALLVDLRRNLEGAQQRMRDTANRHRRDVQFAVGDKVLLKLQQYRQHSVARPLSAKLSRRFYGPFVITERIGPVAYRLQLPQGARIHDVFHVSLLKPFIEGAPSVAIADLPADFVEGRVVVKPLRILDRRIALQGGSPVDQILVEWPGSGVEGATWEPLAQLSNRFPALLEDKEPLIGEGVDTSEAIAETSEDVVQQEHADPEEPQPEVASDRGRKVRVEANVRKDRPKRQSRPPVRFGDFVSR